MNAILNLTQHAASPAQIEAGVVDLTGELKEELTRHLTFDTLPTGSEIDRAARCIAAIASHLRVPAAMIGGAPYLMGPLEAALKAVGVKPLYAFSVRESVETTLPDGRVVKTAVFRHLGFVEA
jgi:hypothetical protein